MSEVKEISDSSFNDEIAEGVAIVDFWAEWCGPCRVQGPIMEQLAAKLEGQVNVYKMDVDSNPITASRLGIHSIPTLLVYKNGEIVKKMVGVQTLDILEEAVTV